MSEQIKYPAIDPHAQGAARPYWSVMIPTYNRTRYLQQALESVLEQDLGPDQMQIEIVDNCSTKDDPEEVLQRVGKNRVSFYRQPSHVGMSANWNACIRRACGLLVHILNDDDLVLPGFYSRLGQAFQKEPTIGAAFCRYIYLDDSGHWQSLSPVERATPGILLDWLSQIAVMQRIQAPAIVVRRRVYEEIGGFCASLAYAFDWEMWKRIAVYYPVWYEPQPLACFRVHAYSESARLLESGTAKDIADTREAIRISESYLPKTVSCELTSKANEHYALYAFSTAQRMILRHDFMGALAQVREALKCSWSLRVIAGLGHFVVQLIAGWGGQTIRRRPTSTQGKT